MKLKRGKIIRWRSRLLVEVYSWSENKKNPKRSNWSEGRDDEVRGGVEWHHKIKVRS